MTRTEQLQELGRIHGRQGKRLPNFLFAGLKAHEIATYHDGLFDGHEEVKDNPTVDNRYLHAA